MPSWTVQYKADSTFEVEIEADTLGEAHKKFDSGDWDGQPREIECIGDAAADAQWTENK